MMMMMMVMMRGVGCAAGQKGSGLYYPGVCIFFFLVSVPHSHDNHYPPKKFN